MKDMQSSLEYIGFKPKEAKIYLALLELGEASVVQIARNTGIKRTTIYNILPSFINRRVISSTLRKRRKIYFVEDPRALQNDIVEKGDVIKRMMPELLAIQNVIPSKPRITFYEGLGGMKDLYQDTLDSSQEGDVILSYTGLADFSNLMPKEYADYYIGERTKRKVRIRVIASNSPTAQSWKDAAIQDLRDIRIVNKPNFHFNADMEIYANKVALISYRENFLGVIIESKEINHMQRAAFELMWSSLEPEK